MCSWQPLYKNVELHTTTMMPKDSNPCCCQSTIMKDTHATHHPPTSVFQKQKHSQNIHSNKQEHSQNIHGNILQHTEVCELLNVENMTMSSSSTLKYNKDNCKYSISRQLTYIKVKTKEISKQITTIPTKTWLYGMYLW